EQGRRLPPTRADTPSHGARRGTVRWTARLPAGCESGPGTTEWPDVSGLAVDGFPRGPSPLFFFCECLWGPALPLQGGVPESSFVSLCRFGVRLGARAHLAQFGEHASLLLGGGLLPLLLLLLRHDDLDVGLRAETWNRLRRRQQRAGLLRR